MRHLGAGVIAAVLLVTAACGDDDDADSAPATDGDEAAESTTTTAAEAELTITSSAFEEGAEIPVEHSCQGTNTSPPLAWEGVPENATELAVVVTDPDAGGFVHWVIAGIDPGETGLDAGQTPAGAVETVNEATQPGYFGPCPPETHTYAFTLYALREASGVTAESPPRDALAQLSDLAIAQGELTGEFTPPG